MSTYVVDGSIVNILPNGEAGLGPVNAPNHVARLAFALIERWGCIAADSDGEDSAGRSKMRLQTPEELVDRAFNIAELAYGEAQARGLTIDLDNLRKQTEKRGS